METIGGGVGLTTFLYSNSTIYVHFCKIPVVLDTKKCTTFLFSYQPEYDDETNSKAILKNNIFCNIFYFSQIPYHGLQKFHVIKNEQTILIVLVAWKCVETNFKLLLRKIFFEIFLVQSDVMNENFKKQFSPPRKPLSTWVSVKSDIYPMSN